MTTLRGEARNPLVRTLVVFGGTAIVLAALIVAFGFPRDPNPDWLDVLQEGAFLVGGIGALWGATRVDSPILTAGALLLTASLALELADEFILTMPVVDQWLPTVLAALGLSTFAWGLAALATRQHENRARLRSSERRLEDYEARLEVAAMKDEFVASMSHELQTPLTDVIGAAATLDNGVGGPLSRAQRELVALISSSAEHLLAIINDLIELSRLESGRAALTREDVDIAHCCDEAWAEVAVRAQAKWLDSSFAVPRTSGSLFTDSRRLRQMLANLLDNAVKFTPSGGRIGLDVTRDEHSGHVLFTVWDSGPGINPADQARLFEPFVQLNSEANREQQGTGLGLALVRRTARALGGDARVESTVGAGSRFTISLPVNPPAA